MWRRTMWVVIVLYTIAYHGVFVARLFVPFSVNTALGWMMLAWVPVVAAIALGVVFRRRAGFDDSVTSLRGLAGSAAMAAVTGVALLALAPVLGW